MSTFTPNKSIEQPAAGSDNNTWAVPVNADWGIIDTALGGNSAILVTGVGSGTYVLTLAQYQPPNIVFSGVMGGNLTYAVPSGVGGLWSVFNNTSGGFALTFQSQGGSYVIVPQGQRAWLVCDGANMQYAQTGGAAAGNPSALVSTSAINGIAATYMRSDGAPAIDQTMSPTWTGIHTFSNSAAFNGNVSLSATWTMGAGAVINGTSGIVNVATPAANDNSAKAANTTWITSYFAALAGPTFTGVPKAPTAAVGTATTQLATTAFVNPAQSLTEPGYVKLASGLIIQWGINNFNSGGSAITFSGVGGIAFPNGSFIAIANAYGTAATAYVVSVTSTQLTAVNGINGTNSWIAIGY